MVLFSSEGYSLDAIFCQFQAPLKALPLSHFSNAANSTNVEAEKNVPAFQYKLKTKVSRTLDYGPPLNPVGQNDFLQNRPSRSLLNEPPRQTHQRPRDAQGLNPADGGLKKSFQ
jgi:hypothetical protein